MSRNNKYTYKRMVNFMIDYIMETSATRRWAFSFTVQTCTGAVTIECFHMTSWRPYFCVPNQSSGSWNLFVRKGFLLFQQICIDAGHVSENTLLRKIGKIIKNRKNSNELTTLVIELLSMLYFQMSIKELRRADIFNF